MEILLVYALLTSSAFYLGSRATITRWLWSRYPARLASFMDCAACSGFWYGLIVGVGSVWTQSYTSGLGPFGPNSWYSPIIIALCSTVWTPIVAGYMQAGFERLGSAVADEDDGG